MNVNGKSESIFVLVIVIIYPKYEEMARPKMIDIQLLAHSSR